MRQNRFTRHGLLSEAYRWAHAFGKINIESTTEANKAKALTRTKIGALLDKANNTPSNQTCYLCIPIFRPSSREIVIELRSLCSDALSREAFKNLPW